MKTSFKIKIPHFFLFYQHLETLNVACNIFYFFSLELVANSFLHRKRSYYFYLRRAHPWSSLEIRRYPADRSRGTDDGKQVVHLQEIRKTFILDVKDVRCVVIVCLVIRIYHLHVLRVWIGKERLLRTEEGQGITIENWAFGYNSITWKYLIVINNTLRKKFHSFALFLAKQYLLSVDTTKHELQTYLEYMFYWRNSA